MALTNEMQNILDNLKADIDIQELNKESILQRLEETKNKIGSFYDQKASEFNSKDYYEEITDQNGTTTQKKIEVFVNQSDDNETKRLKLEQGYNKVDTLSLQKNGKSEELNSDFQKSLQEAVKSNEQNQINLKKEAETLLKIKSKLIENTLQIAEKMKSEMRNISSQKSTMQAELDQINEDIKKEEEKQENIKKEMENTKEKIEEKEEEAKRLELEANKKMVEIEAKKEELQNAISSGRKPEEIEKIRKEFETLNNEYTDYSKTSNETLVEANDLKKEYDKKKNNDLQLSKDSLNNLNNLKANKEEEIANFPDQTTYEAFFAELSNIKKGLDKSLEKDILEFNDKFAEAGIDFTEGTKEEKEIEKEEVKEENDKKDSKETKNAGTSNVVAQENLEEIPEENGILDITDRKSSNEIANKFMEASLDEQEKFLKYYGYEDLAKSAEHLGPFARVKLAKCLEEHLNNSKPTPEDFLNAVSNVSNSSLNYDSFFDKNNNLLSFNKLDINTLREIQEVISDFNANKANMSKDEIEFFDKNFMNFVKNGALLQSVKTGKVKGLLQGFGSKATVRKNILNAMSSYTRENANNISQKENISNKLRDRLGLQIKDPSSSIEETRLNRRVKEKEDLNR